ncbi:MAG: HlyD family efflux transporter periplasmic adaptor subunit [Pseudomonadota bacterium]
MFHDLARPDCARTLVTLGAATAFLLSAALAEAQNPRSSVMLSGEVYSQQAQEVIVPLTTNWQSRISRLAPEGSFVEKDQVIIEFDGTEAARQLEQQRETTRTEQARTERDLARLQLYKAQAEYGVEIARVDLELATLKAEIPEGVIGGIEYAENQLAFEEATNALENAKEALDDRSRSLKERASQAALDEQKLDVQEDWWAQMLESFTIEAVQPGFVIYGNHPWTRAKFQEGDNVQTSFKIAQVANTDSLAVKVWVNGVDRPHIETGDPVRVFFDALPGQRFEGEIVELSDSGAQRGEWGDADYYEGIIGLRDDSASLLPGMSALVEVMP